MWGFSLTFFFTKGPASVSDDGLLELIRSHITEAGFELVECERGGTSRRPVFKVRADILDSKPGHGISVAQCAALSRSLEQVLEANPAVGPQYLLEVSSPGLERPVRWPEHWRRFVGRQVRVRSPKLGGKRTAEIVAVPDDEHVVLRYDDQEVTVALSDIRQATLVVDWDTIGKP
jgi:ribosome maturation factor RimP